MDNQDFDTALIRSAFELAAARGWRMTSVAEAARRADLPLARARARFPHRAAILLRFGRQADQHALADIPAEPAARDRLFDLLMRRFDALQEHRPGILALLRALPADPAAALLLASATRHSMGWMLEAAGIASTGCRGQLRRHGLLAVWLAGLRAWQRDESPDLSGTMAAIDRALDRAVQLASWLERENTPQPGAASSVPEPSATTPPPA